MLWIRERIGRARRFGSVVVGLVLVSVSLSTALGYWLDKLGWWGTVVIGAAVLLGLLGAILMPETAWRRLTGESTFAEDLGRLHTEGVQLRQELPRGPDSEPAPFDAWEVRAEDWRVRVIELLKQSGPRLEGVFNSPVVTGVRTAEMGYYRRSKLGHWIQERLERLSQIMSAVGGSR